MVDSVGVTGFSSSNKVLTQSQAVWAGLTKKKVKRKIDVLAKGLLLTLPRVGKMG